MISPADLLALAANDTGDKRSIVACAATLAISISAITGCPLGRDRLARSRPRPPPCFAWGRHLRRLVDAMEARYSITSSARARSVWRHVETRCRNTLRSADGGAGSSSATDVGVFVARSTGRKREGPAFAGGYSLELLPARIRRSRFYTGLCATAGRTVRKGGKAVLRHRVRYVTAIRRLLADAAINKRLKACHTLVLTQ
jgi:hypothetical protein